MSEELPLVPSVANYRVGTSIDGGSYILDVRWNGREGFWYLDLLAEDEDPIVLGAKIAVGSFVGRRSVDPRFPNGGIAVVDLSGDTREATFDDLGVRVVVRFFTFGELFG